MNRAFSFLPCLLLLVFNAGANADAAPTESKVRFGALAELSGPGAMNGEACLLGYHIASNLFRQLHPAVSEHVEVIYGDHRREAKTAVAEFQRLANMGVWAVAANHSVIGVAINPLSAQMKIPLFGVMGHESFVRDNPLAIRIIPTAAEEGGGLAQQAFQGGARRAAILLLEDDYILAVGEAFAKAFKGLGGEIVYQDTLVESTLDFATIGTRIRASRPDVIAMTLGFQQFGPAIRRLREQGVIQPLFANYWLSYPSVLESAGAANVEGSVFVTERSEYPKFLQEFEKISAGQFRSGVVFRCYAALYSAFSVLADHPSVRSKEQYIDALKSSNAFALPDGDLKLESREAKFILEYYTIRDGKPVQR